VVIQQQHSPAVKPAQAMQWCLFAASIRSSEKVLEEKPSQNPIAIKVRDGVCRLSGL
jgi:hypothetical protein